VPGKTGEFDTSISLDLPRHQLLFPALRRLTATLRENDHVFPFDYPTLLRAWNGSLSALMLSHLRLSPYCLRHGGASEDRASSSRPLLEVQKRGGWRTFESVRRYEKHARHGLLLHRVPPALLREAAAREPELSRLLLVACEKR